MPQGIWRVVLALCAALTSSLLTPRGAQACSCAGIAVATIEWPRQGATDVATDTPIVVGRFGFTGSLASSLPVLAAESGEVVPLVETSRVSNPGDVCGPADYLFLRPARALAPASRYTLGFSQDTPLLQASRVGFQTGGKLFESELPVSPEVQLLAVYPDPACTRPDCHHLDELRVALAALPARALWLQLHSAAEKDGDGYWVFSPEGTPGAQPSVQRPVVVSPSDGCIDIRILGVEGRALYSERRCRPDRCAVYSRIATSSCGGPPFTDLDAARVPDNSCEHPPLITGSGGLIVYPPSPAPGVAPAAPVLQPAGQVSNSVAAAGGPANAPVEPEAAPAKAAGCSAFHAGSRGAGSACAWLLLALFCGRHRRAMA